MSKLKDIDTSELVGTTTSFDAHFITEKIIEFGKVLTGVSLYTYQEDIVYRAIYSVITFEGSILTILLSRQSGKSETMAFIIDTLTVLMPSLAKIIPELEQFSTGFRVGLFAPQSDQVTTTYGRALTRIKSANAELVLSDPDIDVELTSYVRLELTNGSFLKGQVASKQSKVESQTYDLVIIEEAQDVDDFLVEKSILPMVSSTSGSVFKVGTTGTVKNHFWKDIQFNRNLDIKVSDTRLLNHLEYDYQAVIKARRKKYSEDGRNYHLNYENDISRKLQRQGKDSQAFKLGYALIWDLESGMLISDKEFNGILNRKKGFGFAGAGDVIVAGLDIAKSPASTIFTIAKVYPNDDGMHDKKLKEILRWVDLGGLDYEAQHHALLDYILEYNIMRIFADYGGVGRPVVDRLIYNCGDYTEIVPYPFTSQSKSDLGYNMISNIQTHRLVIPANKVVRGSKEFVEFELQMKNCQKFFRKNYLVYEKSEGFFDDYVDSLALMLMAADSEGEAPQEMEVEVNPIYSDIMSMRNSMKVNSY